MIPFLHGVFATNGGVASDFELIETQTVGAGGAASVTFSSIPSTYKHLQIRGIVRGNAAANTDSTIMRFNSDSGSNYTFHWLYGNGSTAESNAIVPYSGIRWAECTGSTAAASVFGAIVSDVLDYASTAKYKTVRTLGGDDRNGAGQVELDSGMWMNTAAISSITISPIFGSALAQYSTFSLYGVK